MIISGDFRKEASHLAFVIDVEAIVGNAVADREIRSMDYSIVDSNLMKYVLGNLNRRRLVLYHHTRGHIVGKEQTVATESLVIDGKRDLVAQKRCGIIRVGAKVVDEVLAYPFLRSQGYISAAQRIEDLLRSVDKANICLK